ncbi:type I glyceraldehyde-3-phosphate dehydrogenase [Candidatus Fermentibacteria bacterium]|nr:type I glyceraldehyde-3-phosphate dehydrogenase [Candidatus Fermentibacteria bacterium]
MGTKVAINGFGRIGRLVYRHALRTGDIDVVAVNDITDPATLAYLLRYDSVHGKFPGEVVLEGDVITTGDESVKVLSEPDPSKLPWEEMDVGIVIESTGLFRTRDKAAKHLQAGAAKILLSAPAKGEEGADLTVVYGVNHELYNPGSHTVLSTASCTTNCLVPVAKVLHDRFGIRRGIMTTIHAYTSNQNILDLPHKDLRRGRAAAVNLVPTTTGAAKAVGLVIPELNGRLDGMAARVPLTDGSLVDLVCELEKDVTVDQVNSAMRTAAEGPLQGILGYSEEPLVSTDIVGDARSSIFDAEMTRVMDGGLVKVLSWYDNEYGYAARMVDMARYMLGKGL